jgi:hypothetical protein
MLAVFCCSKDNGYQYPGLAFADTLEWKRFPIYPSSGLEGTVDTLDWILFLTRPSSYPLRTLLI